MKKALLPLGIVVIAFAVAIIVVRSKARVQPKPQQPVARAVRVIEVTPQSVQMTVKSQGDVEARTASTLAAEVAGTVVWVSPHFVAGGFFEKGERLLRVDARDYEYAAKQSELGVAQAELALKIEIQEGEVAVAEWRKIDGPQDDAPPLVSRQPQRAQAQASLAAAQAALAQAQLNLSRAAIRAPYTGRVSTKNVDVGQYVSPGMAVASVYAIDYAEVRLPVRDNDLAFLEVPFDYRGAPSRTSGPEALLRASFGGRTHEWRGWLSRLEGELDRATRMAYAVVRIENPYGHDAGSDRPPLTVGMFVDVEIAGRAFEGIYVIPRPALQDGDRIAIVDADDRLYLRDVEILRRDAEFVYILSGLNSGERICISSLDAATDGMLVTPFDETPSFPAEVTR